MKTNQNDKLGLVFRQAIIGTLFFGFMTACGSSHLASKRVLDDNYKVPPGVDSTVARIADSLQVFLFVDAERQKKIEQLKIKARERLQRSDSLWAKVSHKNEVSANDSMAASGYIDEGKRSLGEMSDHFTASNNGESNADEYKKIGAYLDEAVRAFENAILLNPYDTDARSWLARVYSLKAERFESENDYERAAGELENLLQLEKGKHEIYYRLAENYYKMNAWQPAYDIFVQAERVLKETSFLRIEDPEATLEDLNNAPVDTSILFYYRYYQGITQARLYNADNALRILKSAEKLAKTEKDREAVVSYIDWINWDDGNILGSEIRDSLLVLQNKGDFRKAMNGFLKLVKSLKTQQARDEIEWRAAVLDYQKIGNKDSAVKRLHALIQRTAKLPGGQPADTSYQRYFEDYATMCYNLGLDYASSRKWQEAYAYFLQASQINWKGQAKSHVEIAKIVQNNPDLVIKHCKQAQENENTLSKVEKQQLYQLLSVAYLKKGMTDLAKEARHKLLIFKREEIDNGSSYSR
jgi:tetratricopeptide (TPR) repeat protein